MIKTFKTIDEQIEILKSKGLTIEDYAYAKDVLLRENYFFLSGYRHLFLKSEKDRMFIPGTEFKELYASFENDQKYFCCSAIRSVFCSVLFGSCQRKLSTKHHFYCCVYSSNSFR